MVCRLTGICGGCALRHLELSDYRKRKDEAFKTLMRQIPQADFRLGTPVFADDGTRRRASLAFRYAKGRLTLGFNRFHSAELVDIDTCPLLTLRLNAALGDIRRLLEVLCAEPLHLRKGKKVTTSFLSSGDVWICETDGGIDVVLEIDAEFELGHRMALFETAVQMPDIIRLSHRKRPDGFAEPLMEKSKPYIRIGGFEVYIPAGTFLQPSREGEAALTSLVLHYLGNDRGRIADLFCGVGTFSYVLAADKANKITAADSSPTLLKGFNETIRRNMIPNISVVEKNLFKSPFTAGELEAFDVVLFDPPRAGAAAQCLELAAADRLKRPRKIIAISCNPQSFIRDAGILISGGYRLEEATMVDQFVYSNHSELAAVFTNA